MQPEQQRQRYGFTTTSYSHGSRTLATFSNTGPLKLMNEVEPVSLHAAHRAALPNGSGIRGRGRQDVAQLFPCGPVPPRTSRKSAGSAMMPHHDAGQLRILRFQRVQVRSGEVTSPL